MLRALLESPRLQNWADRLGLTFWSRFLIARHDGSTRHKAWRIFRKRQDPFKYEGSVYEGERFNAMAKLLSTRRFGRALEIGCAEGLFTQRLFPLCAELVSVDLSPQALERAQARLGGKPVKWVCANARTYEPEGRFDLIVLGDFLYYLGDPRKGPAFSRALDGFLADQTAKLNAGGCVLLANGFGTETDEKRNQDYIKRFEVLGLRRAGSEITGTGAHDKGGMRCHVDLLQKPV